MLSTSHDVLNLILALGVLLISFFLCWGLYYLIAGAKRIYRLTRRVEIGVSQVEELIEIARDKLKNSSAYFMILGEIAKRALEFVEEKRSKKQSKTK